MIFLPASAQLDITLYGGLNSTRIYDGTLYEKGGNYPLGGIDLETRLLATRNKDLQINLASGVGFLSNGFYYSSAFSVSFADIYWLETTDLRTQYWQVPVVLKVNWRPFPLVEEWRVFLGFGSVFNYLTRFDLREEYVRVSQEDASAVPPPPVTERYEDRAGLDNYGDRLSMFYRIEAGVRFKRVVISYRRSVAITDMYHQGVGQNWSIPLENSFYNLSHENVGRTKMKFSEMVVGFRIRKN